MPANLKFLAFLLGVQLFGHAMADESIPVYFEERPPYASTGTDGSVQGLTATPTEKAFTKAGIAFHWKEMPFKRQMAEFAQNDKKACGIGWFKKPEREAFARYTLPVYQDAPTVVVSHSDLFKDKPFQSLPELFADSRYKLLVKDGFSYGKYFDGLIDSLSPAMKSTSTGSHEDMLRMVSSKRADYFLEGKEEATYNIQQLGDGASNLKLTSFDDFPAGNKRYIACSHQVSQQTIDRLNSALTSVPVAKTDSPELKISFGVHNAEPYAFINKGKLEAGIIKDISEALSQKLGIKVSYINVPRKRLEAYLKSGKTHIVFMSNPAWVKNADDFYWSIPLFQQSDIFVVDSQRAFPINKFSDLYGKRLGTISGYHYENLDQDLQDGKIIRDDVSDLATNFKKLQSGRIDSLVDANILVDYYLKKHSAKHKFIVTEKAASINDNYAMFTRKPLPIDYERINAELLQLKESGKIDEIIARYR